MATTPQFANFEPKQLKLVEWLKAKAPLLAVTERHLLLPNANA
jgi:hypothetical protein